MRKTLLAAALALATVAPAIPAQAGHLGSGTEHFALTVDVPCLVVCSYWIDNGFTPCEHPFPPGSYEDKVTKSAPTPPTGRVGVVTYEMTPVLDWDSWICANNTDRTELGRGANIIGDPCDGILGPSDYSGTGCKETITIPTLPGQTYRLRGYNWQDGPIDCPAAYRFFWI